jgi:hypothetical protein
MLDLQFALNLRSINWMIAETGGDLKVQLLLKKCGGHL